MLDAPSPRAPRRGETPVDTGSTQPEIEVVMTDVTPPIARPSVVTNSVSWYTPTTRRWVAYRGSSRVGSIDHVGAFIAVNQHGDVLGAFIDLVEAQRAIVDPQPADADLVRRSRARQARFDARLRRAAITVMTALLVIMAAGAALLLASAR